jgi:hypothetical protein
MKKSCTYKCTYMYVLTLLGKYCTILRVHHVGALERHTKSITVCAFLINCNARCVAVEEDRRPGIATGYVLFRAPQLVQS